MKGKLYLIPSTIGDTDPYKVIPAHNKEIIAKIRHYIVENERSARRMLIKMGLNTPIDDLHFYVLDKQTTNEEAETYLTVLAHEDAGLLSEAGMPAVADPGNILIYLAHQNNIKVIPLSGPSSILMALMSSGLNGQNFVFNGYLPVKRDERIRKIRQLETRSSSENQTQIFMETPYRNNQLIQDILSSCQNKTLLCIAAGITTEEENIHTKTISEWRNQVPDFNKIPAIYILHAG